MNRLALLATTLTANYAAHTTRLEWASQASGVSTYRGGVYCGPGWGFTQEDIVSGRIRELPAALDAIDEACRRHDQCYADRGWLTLDCNVELSRSLAAVVISRTASEQQRIDAAVMAAIFMTEVLTIDTVVLRYRQLHAGASVARELLKVRIDRAIAAGRTMRDAILELLE